MKDSLTTISGVLLLAWWLTSPIEDTGLRARALAPEQNLREITLRKSLAERMNEFSARTSVSGEKDETVLKFAESGMTEEKVPDGFDSETLMKVNPASFFLETSRFPPSSFTILKTEFFPHSQCPLTPAALRESFDSSIRNKKLLSTAFIPDSEKILDLNLYFEFQNKFYQLSLEPSADQSGSFEVSLIQSEDAQFSASVRRIPNSDGDLKSVFRSQDEALREIKKLVREYTGAGARWGSRTVLLTGEEEHRGAGKSETVRIELNNGQVRGFLNHRQECHLAIQNTLECMCR
jgi:hypothetical protein